MREVYTGIDNSIVKALNEEYEEELLILAGLIPNDWIEGFYDSVELVFDLAACVNVERLAKVVNKHGRARLWFSVSTYNAFINNFVIDKGYSKQGEKAVINICDKFQPLFKAVDKLISNPKNILDKIALISSESSENQDVLLNLI